jgi:hypothetical protein
MDFNLIFQGAFSAFFTLFIVAILLQRARFRRKKAANKNYRGFYPSTAALSLALISLQTLAQPDLHHSIEQRQTIAEDEEENGDPDDPSAQLTRQLKRIRNGSPLEGTEALKIPLVRSAKK